MSSSSNGDVPPNPLECYDLALDYLRGRNGKSRNEFAAYHLLEIAAKRNFHKAQRTLGELYMKGVGCIYPPNPTKALQLMELAAAGGDPIAIHFMNVHKPGPLWIRKAIECEYITCDVFSSFLLQLTNKEDITSEMGEGTKLYMDKIALYKDYIIK